VDTQYLTPENDRITDAMLQGIEGDFRLAYRLGGLHTALGVLNARTRFRMTALCPVGPDSAIAATIYDRENPRAESDQYAGELRSIADSMLSDGESDLAASCTFVSDATTRAHVTSYVGAAIRRGAGTPWAVLFHYDIRLRLVPRTERQLLEHLAARLEHLCPLPGVEAVS
jgi:hypothetical protein